MEEYLFLALLACMAFLYASVGHGGASGYLALMALFGFAPSVMRPSALTLNILVSGIAFWQYRKHMKWELFVPLALASVPAAYWGGLLHMDQAIYKKALGVLLFFPVARFLFYFEEKPPKEAGKGLLLLVGAVIGLLSGLIGIGGGIILTPLLLLMGWARVKEAANVSALFIFVNSVAGLAGSLTGGEIFSVKLLPLVGVAVLGGTLGSYLGASFMGNRTLTRILGITLAVAAVKLLLG